MEKKIENKEKETRSYVDLNIYQKMSLATDKIQKVAKNLNVGLGKNTYKAVGEADVLEAVKPVEVELGIYSYPISRKVIDTNILTTVSEYEGNTKEKNQLFMRLEIVYRFVNVDKPDDFIDITTYGDGIDTGDKAPGKAMTYGDKYALLKAYKIETGEDPDKDPSGELKGAKKNTAQNNNLQQARENKMISPNQLAILTKWASTEERKNIMLNDLNVKTFEELTLDQASKYIGKMLKKVEENKKKEAPSVSLELGTKEENQ